MISLKLSRNSFVQSASQVSKIPGGSTKRFPRKLCISEQRWTTIMGMLVREGYVDGIGIRRSVDGEVAIPVSSPRITLKGLEYLKENSLMQKAADVAKGIAEMIP